MRDPLKGLGYGYLTALCCVGMLTGIVTWSALSEVEIAVRGEGSVVPFGSNRRAQHLEGGVVTQLMVREGDVVVMGQVLAIVAPESAGAEAGERRSRIEGLRAMLERLSSEAEGRPPVFRQPSSEREAAAIRQETVIHSANRTLLDSRIAALAEGAARNEADARAKAAQLEGLRVQEAALGRSVAMHQQAIRGGAGLPGRLSEAEAQLAAVRASMAGLPSAIESDKAAARESLARAVSERALSLQDAAGRTYQVRAELESLLETVRSSEERLRRTEVIAPIAGVVQKMNVFAVGEVVPPNSTVAEIVPTGEGLIVEARVPPDKVRGLRAGLPAIVRISAYDVSRFGSLDGNVVSVSPDAIRDERTGQSHYRVRIRTEAAEVRGEPIVAGMQTDVSIITGSRTVLNYFTSPIVTFSQVALRER